MRKIREVLRLYFAAALSIRAIARSLGTSPSRVRLHRAHRLLLRRLLAVSPPRRPAPAADGPGESSSRHNLSKHDWS